MSHGLDERTALAGTLEEIRQARQRLVQERERIDQQISERDQLLSFWETRLAQLDRLEDGQPRLTRMRKGEPKRMVIETLQQRGERGMSIMAISEATGMGWSTVRSVLKKAEAPFIERDGQWHFTGSRDADTKTATGNGIEVHH